jgi:N-acetylglucosaminyldiphosphoundecaprenol N-acetyl-beta-D-mannosaminyltransferase
MLQANSVSSERYRFLGITVDAVTSDALVKCATDAINSNQRRLLFGNHNLHSLYLANKDQRLREFYTMCHLTHIDGMSLIALGRALGAPLERCHRTTYLDWIELFLKQAELRGWRIFVIGGTSDFSATLPRRLQQKFPNLQLRTHGGFFSPQENAGLYREIKEFAPHVVMVGMGMPRQEYWIMDALPHLDTNLIFNCGAAFEYLAGEKYRPPRWAGQLGIEWLFRMASEPRRLAARYLIEPFHLMPHLTRALFDSTLRSRRLTSALSPDAKAI